MYGIHRTWQESLDPELYGRLTRALVQPGSVSMRTVRRIFGWLEELERRRGLSAEVLRRFSPTGQSRTDQVAIVHARWTGDVGKATVRETRIAGEQSLPGERVGAPREAELAVPVQASSKPMDPRALASGKATSAEATTAAGARVPFRAVVRAKRLDAAAIARSSPAELLREASWKIVRPTRIDSARSSAAVTPERAASEPRAPRLPLASRLLHALSYGARDVAPPVSKGAPPEKASVGPEGLVELAPESPGRERPAGEIEGATRHEPPRQRVRPTPYLARRVAPPAGLRDEGGHWLPALAASAAVPSEARQAVSRPVVASKSEVSSPDTGAWSGLPRVQARAPGSAGARSEPSSLAHASPLLGGAAPFSWGSMGAPAQPLSPGAPWPAAAPIVEGRPVQRGSEGPSEPRAPRDGGTRPVTQKGPRVATAVLGEMDMDSLVDKVQRSLLRQAAVERERKGGRR